jgi:hypothetical protein
VEEGERETKRNRLAETETEHWRVLEMARVVKLAIGIKQQCILIKGLNTILIKLDKNRFGVVLKFAVLCRDLRSP